MTSPNQTFGNSDEKVWGKLKAISPPLIIAQF